METLIFLAIATWAVKKGVESGHLNWFRSRDASRAAARGRSVPRRAASAVQHDIGYWAHQVFHGFPVARQGLADGWHAGRMTQAEGRAVRAKAKADHLTLRARLIPELREHSRRQEEALAQIRAARAPQPAPGPGEGAGGNYPERYLLTVRSRSGSPVNQFTGEPFDTIGVYGRGDLDRRLAAATRDPDLETGYRPMPPPGEGWPDGWAAEEETGEGTSPREPQEPSTREPSTTEGSSNMASEVTYEGVLRHVTMAADFEEAAQAERAQRATQANQIAEQMQALRVDPATLGAMADYLDAMQEALKAQQRAVETAQAVAETLKRGHAGLAEAHASAPVQAADREFYEEG